MQAAPLLPDDFDALVALVATEPDPDRLRAAYAAAATLCGLRERCHNHSDLVPFAALDPAQQRLARALDREAFGTGGWGVPTSRRLLRRWLGVEAPGILDRPLKADTDPAPLWQRWRDAPPDTLEYNQGVPDFVLAALSPAEVIEAAAESVLEPYGIHGSPLETRLHTLLLRDGAQAAGWAEGFADLAVSLRSPDGPHARPEAYGYDMLGLYDWDTLGVLILLPLVRAGRPLEARWDVLVPFAASQECVREILAALPPERAEAVVYHRLCTDWGPGGEKALNGFDSGLAVLDLAPSIRVTQILSGKLKNNRGFFKKRMERIRARLDALAALHPGVAEGLKPRRGKAAPRP